MRKKRCVNESSTVAPAESRNQIDVSHESHQGDVIVIVIIIISRVGVVEWRERE